VFQREISAARKNWLGRTFAKWFKLSNGGGIWISQTTPTPFLNIVNSNSNFALSWLVLSTNFALQQNLDLTTTNWVTLTNAPTLNLTNLNNELTFPQTNSSDFYRLITQ
jgi:hypothetical protein